MKHDEKKEYTVRLVECSTRPIHYDPKLCIGCNRCVDTCQCDILMPNQAKFVPVKNNVIYKESAEWILNISHSALL